MGPNHVHECLAALRRTLPPSEWRTLTSARAALPSWMARAIGEYRHRDGTRNKRLQPSGGLAAWGDDEAGAAEQGNADGGE